MHIENVMRAGVLQDVAAGFAVLALILAAVGPCICLLDVQECHGSAATATATDHACCDEPTGVQAVADECCDAETELVAATTDVPEVSPPALQGSPAGHDLTVDGAVSAEPVRIPPPLAPDRTTVLLI